MDYEFLRDITGVVKVRMSMDHEAIGHWFNEEVKGNLALLDEVEQAARTVKGSERSWQRAGHEYTLWLDGEEVMIRANQLEFSGDEIEEGMSYYDEESLSLCGVEDFLQVVAAYREFMQQLAPDPVYQAAQNYRPGKQKRRRAFHRLHGRNIAAVVNLAHLFP